MTMDGSCDYWKAREMEKTMPQYFEIACGENIVFPPMIFELI
jgi:hypothetical protein